MMHDQDAFSAGSGAPRADHRGLPGAVLDALEKHIAVLDGNGVVLFANRAWRDFLAQEEEGRHLRAGVGEPCRGVHLPGPDGRSWVGQAEVTEILAGTRAFWQVQYPVSTQRGLRWFAMRLSPFVLPGGNGALVVHEDISERKELEEQLSHHAFHDRLTALPNRALLLDRLNMAVKRSKRQGRPYYALLYLDIDRFNLVNETLGHVAGDRLLMAISHRLLRATRDVDTLSRFGGDEFVLLLDAIAGEEQARIVAERILDEMREPFRLRRHEIVVSLSIGIVCGSDIFENAGQVLRDAETVMQRAKEQGGGRYEMFSEAMRNLARKRLQMEMDLRRAIEGDQLELYYQPIVSLRNGQIRGLEALARWNHPELGMISPLEFIPVAEETGLIVPLGSWVLRRACAKLAELQAIYPTAAGLTMNVNISGTQFARPGFVQEVEDILAATGVRPGTVKLELTESVIMADAEKAVGVIKALKERGVSVVIDDFGTGYSSLSYLQRFPVNCLKVDRSFVLKMDDTRENREIVKTIIKMAHSLGLEVVAEGVEQQSQLAILAGLNCENGQGFLFSKPLDAGEIDELLRYRLAASG